MFGDNAPKGLIPPLVRGVFNKKTGNFQLLKRPETNKDGFLDDIDKKNTFWPTYYSNDGYLLMPIRPNDENDNPHIMMVKTK